MFLPFNPNKRILALSDYNYYEYLDEESKEMTICPCFCTEPLETNMDLISSDLVLRKRQRSKQLKLRLPRKKSKLYQAKTKFQKYECKLSPCNKKFYTSLELQNHHVLIHKSNSISVKKKKLFYCSIYDCKHLIFFHKVDLRCHIQNVHFNRSLECSYCKILYVKKAYLNKHILKYHATNLIPKLFYN